MVDLDLDDKSGKVLASEGTYTLGIRYKNCNSTGLSIQERQNHTCNDMFSCRLKTLATSLA